METLTLMSDLSQSIFFETIAQLRKDLQENHSRLRQDMTEGFHVLASKIETHAKETRGVENRVLVIETERKGEQAATLKQGAWAALIGATGLTALWEVVKHIWGWK